MSTSADRRSKTNDHHCLEPGSGRARGRNGTRRVPKLAVTEAEDSWGLEYSPKDARRVVAALHDNYRVILELGAIKVRLRNDVQEVP